MPLSAAMALSGVEPDYWGDELKHIYMQGATVLYNPRRKISRSPSSPPPAISSESGISSLSSQSDPSTAGSGEQPDLHAICEELFEKLRKLVEYDQEKEDKKKTELEEPEKKPDLPALPKAKIMYDGRDILNLADNLTGPAFFTPTQLPMGTIDDNYFRNRSQYSCVAGMPLPAHVKEFCPEDDCDFQYITYFE